MATSGTRVGRPSPLQAFRQSSLAARLRLALYVFAVSATLLSMPLWGATVTTRDAASFVIGAVMALLSATSAYLLYRRTAAWRTESLSAAAARIRAGDTSARSGVPHDNSDLGNIAAALDGLAKQVEALKLQLEEKSAALEALEAYRSQMVSTMVHEIRNSLSPISGFSELLLAGSHNLSEAHQRQLKSIYENAKAIETVIDDLAEAARLERGQLKLETRPLDMRATLIAALDAFRSYISARNRLLEVRIGDGPASLNGDVSKIVKVINTLMRNAVERSPDGTTISVEMRCEGDRLLVSVTDAGTRISEEELAAMFVQFASRAGRTRHDAATASLGMAVARGLVQVHGGQMAVSNGPAGCTFSFWLPCQS